MRQSATAWQPTWTKRQGLQQEKCYSNYIFDHNEHTEMPIVPYVPDMGRYEDVFGSQHGSGVMMRHRGSPYQNGSGFPLFRRNICSKIGSFVKPLLRQAAPHAKAAMNAAAPHLKEAATGLLKKQRHRQHKQLPGNFQQRKVVENEKELPRRRNEGPDEYHLSTFLTHFKHPGRLAFGQASPK